MATPRHRSRVGTLRSGYRLSSAGTTTTTYWNDFSEVCDDVVGDKGGNHPLILERKSTFARMTMTGTYNGQLYVGMPVTYYRSIGHLALPPRPSDADLTTDVIAISNPSKPMVDLPVFVFEMLDLPELLKNTGDLLLKPKSQTARDAISGMLNDPKVASTFLTWEFGWAPLDLGYLQTA